MIHETVDQIMEVFMIKFYATGLLRLPLGETTCTCVCVQINFEVFYTSRPIGYILHESLK